MCFFLACVLLGLSGGLQADPGEPLQGWGRGVGQNDGVWRAGLYAWFCVVVLPAREAGAQRDPGEPLQGALSVSVCGRVTERWFCFVYCLLACVLLG
jgi:hypothetical protein